MERYFIGIRRVIPKPNRQSLTWQKYSARRNPIVNVERAICRVADWFGRKVPLQLNNGPRFSLMRVSCQGDVQLFRSPVFLTMRTSLARSVDMEISEADRGRYHRTTDALQHQSG